ncbi:N-acetylglucosamine-6-phosphate deacetylase [Algoriphagus sanaruensis]|uniref:N-acetylglucosamine-6-phosphate deacetylase n=1 Tax=Algoriphagus sanaruensis TaxID=1727163 RepID=A0A142EPQ9_9BACT|nr:N-acetylglucosamine-6-phosphate deacetylase [Algoriphagus sanaruensis]AMQ57114.1 N-acetylglucosamine-6-phosphate deacetylase [Algoriphagus sanaruensis]
METRLIGKSFWDGKPMEICVSEGKIKSVSSVGTSPENLWIGPGFTDIQVNGYGGLDYNSLQSDILALGQISKKLLKCGVTSHFPTIITNSPGNISTLIQQVVQLRKMDPVAASCISGIHIEGPFISPEDGPRGAHFKEFVQGPDWDLFQKWIEESEGLIRMITLSPEWEGSSEFIEKCVESGILVSIGHTNATHSQIQYAQKAGARLSTHLGNGMHGVITRHPNYLWSQLASESLSATIIADGFHLPAEVIQVFKKVKGEKLMLVSDSVALAGMPAGDYEAEVGGKVTLTPEGKLHLFGNPNMLAGSAMNILQGINFLLRNNLADLPEAWQMASIRPQRLFEPTFDPFQIGQNADLILAEQQPNLGLKILKVLKNGVEIPLD